jgi:hypothetical protein
MLLRQHLEMLIGVTGSGMKRWGGLEEVVGEMLRDKLQLDSS